LKPAGPTARCSQPRPDRAIPMMSPHSSRTVIPRDQRERRPDMAKKEVKFSSPYDKRLQLVVDTIQRHEKLSDQATSALAVHVLHALDHIPERVR
jgi:hypothetical protein